LWFSETADIWGDSHGSFAAAKRGLYTAIRHQQIPLDFVVEQDALDGTLAKYKVLYLTDAHVSQAASKKIADWVASGGQLFATAGAGMFDELNRPNKALRKVLGVSQTKLEAPEGKHLIWLKQDLPFAAPIATVKSEKAAIPVFGARSHVALDGAQVDATFHDGIPAVTHNKAGKGVATYCAYLPALSYYHPAIPKRPVDRGATDDAMVHFLPTEFDARMAALIASPAAVLIHPITCSEPLVETMLIESPHGTAISLVNWSGRPTKDLTVNIRVSVPKGKVSLASGRKVRVERTDAGLTVRFDCPTADVLIIRK
jgi:hypothetical protein